MATFQAQVHGLTSLTISSSGTSPTEAELTQFLTDGAKEIIIQFPPNMLDLCSAQQTFTSVAPGSEAETMNTGKVLSVFRNDGDIDQPCRKISSTNKGRVLDSDDMSYASITDPIYYTENNKINSLPSGGSCKYSEVQYPAVTYGDSAISVFPDEAEYLVALYGAVKSLQNVLGDKSSNSDITTALTAVNAEIDECLIIADNMHTEIGKALTEIGEAIGLVDNSSNIQVAVDAMNTALDKFRADAGDPGLFGDEDVFDTSASQLTRVKDALNNAEKIIDDGANSPTGNAAGDAATYLYTDEDTELLQGALSIATTEIQRAQTHISEWNAVVQTLQAEVSGFSSEAQARYGWIKAKADVWNGELSSAQGYGNEIQSKIGIAQAYVSEVQSRLSVDTAQYGWYEKQQAKLQADYDKGVQKLIGGSA